MKSYVWSLFILPFILGLEGHARTPSHGDGFLYLGDSGYAYLEDASVADFDYAQDLSVEVVARIEPHQEGGRWATFLEKGGDPVLSQASSPGFGMGTSEGNAPGFGKHLQVKIGDGAHHLSLESPKAYQGYVHAVMTWSAVPKTLTMFINGQLIVSRSNSAISSGRIKNKGELRMGRGWYPLRRNLFLARLWNRRLSAPEVTAIWSRFANLQSHDLPPDLDGSGLLSEWVMDPRPDASGNAGVGLLKDRRGKNHLKLAGGARLVTGEGPWKAVFPTNGAAGVDKSVVLTVSGGGSALGGFFTRPLQYLFQIDERATFHSPGLRRSGWMAHYAEWEPILKPSTPYYWRVKVRDSGMPPRESNFSDVYTFRTRSSATWYVRPLVDLHATEDDLGNPVPDPGVYGRQDGTSYENAFNGIAHVPWARRGRGGGHVVRLRYSRLPRLSRLLGVAEGRHHSGIGILVGVSDRHHDGSSGAPRHAVRILPEPGEPRSVGRSGRERGLSHAATCLTAWRSRPRGAGISGWSGPPPRPGKVLGAPRYNVPRAGESWLVDTSYVKMSDGGSPEGRVYSPEVGFRFDLGRSSYIKFAGCRFFNSMLMTDSNDDTESELPPAHHVVLESCDLGYWSESMVEVGEGMNDWIIRGCNIHHTGRGVHAVAAQRLLVEQCSIHEIGAPDFPHNDAHAIGVRNGANHIIQKNHLWNAAGSGHRVLVRAAAACRI